MNTPIQDAWPDLATYCWGCGKNNTHGLQLKSYWENEETVASFMPKEYHLAFPGILNGGIIATLIDCHGTGTANAYATQNTKGQDKVMHVTASLKVNFLKPTPLDQPVTVRGKVTSDDGRKITVSCSLYSGDTLCATGEVVTVGVNPDRFVKEDIPESI